MGKDILLRPAGQIEGGARRNEIEAPLGKIDTAFALQHLVEPGAQFVQVDDIEGRVLLLCVGNAYAFFKPAVTIFGRDFLLFDVGFAAGIVGLVAVLVHSLARNTRELYRAERVR